MKRFLALCVLLLLVIPVLAHAEVKFTHRSVPVWYHCKFTQISHLTEEYYVWTKKVKEMERKGGKWDDWEVWNGKYKTVTVSRSLDDLIDQVIITNGETVTLYEHPQFQGRSITIHDDTPTGHVKSVIIPAWLKVSSYVIHR